MGPNHSADTIREFCGHPQSLSAKNLWQTIYLESSYRLSLKFVANKLLNPSKFPLKLSFLDHSVDQIYPYFLRHAHKVFPHLERINELRIISDLTHPHNWYPLAREIHRKIIFHAGLWFLKIFKKKSAKFVRKKICGQKFGDFTSFSKNYFSGPTNSGKTYEALEEFKKAKSGMYCGPLRLLAFEIYERINKDGKRILFFFDTNYLGFLTN